MNYARFLKLTPIALAMLIALPALAQTDTEQSAADQEAGDIEEVIVTGSQIKGAAINDALSVSVVDMQAIDDFGIESGDELLDVIPEQGQNFFNEAENISGGVNSARGDVGAFNLRNIGTGNTLVLLNGRRVVNSATFQTEEVGGSFVPVNTANSAAIPVFGLERVEVLRDGASAIYGADAVAGVVNTVMRNDYDGFSIRGRYTSYDNIPRDDFSVTIEWGEDDVERVRILGIDTPEVAHPNIGMPFDQSFGREATAFCAGVFAAATTVELIRAAETDGYGRTRGYFFANGMN